MKYPLFVPKIDVAAFQMEAVHEDLAAGFFKVFSERGLRTKGFFNERIRNSRGDFFAAVPHKKTRVEYHPLEARLDWEELARRARFHRPKALYFNTLQRDGMAGWADGFHLPILAVVHNPQLFQQSEPCRELVRKGKIDVFGLAPHVRDDLLRRCPELEGRVHVHYPYVWSGDDFPRPRTDSDVLTIAIPGAVDFRNRDFEGLITFLKERGRLIERPIRLSVLAGGPDRARLEELITEYKLAEYFHLAELDPETRRVPHRVYLEGLYQSDATLALLPSGRQDYLQSKITTGIVASQALARPIIAPKEVGDVYGFNALETPASRPFDLEAIDLSADGLARRQAEGEARRKECLHENKVVLDAVLDRIGMPSRRNRFF